MTSSFNEPPPLVLVEGFLSAGGDIVWGDFSRYMNDFGRNANFGRRRGIFVSIGPVSSLHDRACELFYVLKGGQVNYGKAHAKQNNHEQFGRSHIKGLYPGWSASQPLHFLGHSMGGPTLIKLQHLLQTGFFGPEYGPDMILSLNSVQSPFRGSPVVHALGYYTPDVPNAPKLTVGSLIENSAHILAYLAPAIPIQALDMHADARKLSFTECSFGDLLKQLQHSDWARGKDVGPYDASLQAADERELVGEGAPHPRTFYRSWSSSITTRQSVYTGKHRPTYDMLLNPPLFYTSQFIGSFDYNSIKPGPNVVRDPTVNTDDQLSSVVEDLGEQYYANDGVIPAFSQWHPFHCSSIRCHHFAGTGIRPDGQPGPAAPGEGHSIEPGMWYVHAVQGVSHVGMAPLWLGSSKQKTFWREMGEWLRAVDEHAPEVRGYAIKASTQPADVQTVKITNPSGKPALVASYA